MKNKVRIKNFKGGPRNILVILFFFLVSLFALTKLTDMARTTRSISYSQYVNLIEQGKVASVTYDGQLVTGRLHNNEQFETVVPQNDVKTWDRLRDHNVAVEVVAASNPFSWLYIMFILLFFLVPLALWYFFKQARGSNGSAGNIFSMGKSKAKMFMPQQIKVNFDSVAGAQEAKEELQDIVDFLKNPEKYRRLGAKLTRGVLLVGEPGNGKTLLAKAVAGEANCPFFSISGSDFIEVFVGVGAARVRDLFQQARRYAPSIIFIDEIDAVGRQRGTGLGGGHDEREQTLNQLLTEMDGFDTATSSIVVIGATNRQDVLDKALLRPGRFDRKVFVPYPDLASRDAILRVHAKGVKIDPSIDLYRIARATPGFTGADLAHLINEAAINASKSNQEQVMLHDFEEARDKIMLGKERKGVLLSEEELRITAFHEAGHALVRLLLPEDTEPLHKVTITPRGNALGVTHWLPEREKYLQTKEEMLASIMSALGGRIAEEIVFNKISTGASDDFQRATDIARGMVCYYGMTSDLGPVVYLPNQTTGERPYSEGTAQKIDAAIRNIIDSCYKQATELLKANYDKLEKLATELLDKETLYAADIYTLLGIPSREDHRLH